MHIGSASESPQYNARPPNISQHRRIFTVSVHKRGSCDVVNWIIHGNRDALLHLLEYTRSRLIQREYRSVFTWHLLWLIVIVLSTPDGPIWSYMILDHGQLAPEHTVSCFMLMFTLFVLLGDYMVRNVPTVHPNWYAHSWSFDVLC